VSVVNVMRFKSIESQREPHKDDVDGNIELTIVINCATAVPVNPNS